MHRLDPRAKVLAKLAFVVAVVSFPKHEVAALAPFVFFPLVMIGLFNPLLDRAPALAIGGVEIAAGWLSFASILARFALTMSATLALTATTAFPALCQGLGALGVPRVFVVQLLVLYRYLLLLAEEAGPLRRARELRAHRGRGFMLRSAGSTAGSLFARTLDRAERIYQAMAARGCDGRVRQLRSTRFRPADGLFFAAVAAGAALLRVRPVTHWPGRWGKRL